ncbi:Phosphoserine aminotransferase, partial [human gut metagenome]
AVCSEQECDRHVNEFFLLVLPCSSCATETIGGVAMPYVPTEEAAGVPIVADVSSMYLSRPIDVTKFGV